MWENPQWNAVKNQEQTSQSINRYNCIRTTVSISSAPAAKITRAFFSAIWTDPEMKRLMTESGNEWLLKNNGNFPIDVKTLKTRGIKCCRRRDWNAEWQPKLFAPEIRLALGLVHCCERSNPRLAARMRWTDLATDTHTAFTQLTSVRVCM